MTPKQTEALKNYMRDEFLARYVPDAIQSGFSRKNNPKENTRLGKLKRESTSKVEP